MLRIDEDGETTEEATRPPPQAEAPVLEITDDEDSSEGIEFGAETRRREDAPEMWATSMLAAFGRLSTLGGLASSGLVATQVAFWAAPFLSLWLADLPLETGALHGVDATTAPLAVGLGMLASLLAPALAGGGAWVVRAWRGPDVSSIRPGEVAVSTLGLYGLWLFAWRNKGIDAPHLVPEFPHSGALSLSGLGVALAFLLYLWWMAERYCARRSTRLVLAGAGGLLGLAFDLQGSPLPPGLPTTLGVAIGLLGLRRKPRPIRPEDQTRTRILLATSLGAALAWAPLAGDLMGQGRRLEAEVDARATLLQFQLLLGEGRLDEAVEVGRGLSPPPAWLQGVDLEAWLDRSVAVQAVEDLARIARAAPQGWEPEDPVALQAFRAALLGTDWNEWPAYGLATSQRTALEAARHRAPESPGPQALASLKALPKLGPRAAWKLARAAPLTDDPRWVGLARWIERSVDIRGASREVGVMIDRLTSATADLERYRQAEGDQEWLLDYRGRNLEQKLAGFDAARGKLQNHVRAEGPIYLAGLEPHHTKEVGELPPWIASPPNDFTELAALYPQYFRGLAKDPEDAALVRILRQVAHAPEGDPALHAGLLAFCQHPDGPGPERKRRLERLGDRTRPGHENMARALERLRTVVAGRQRALEAAAAVTEEVGRPPPR